MNNIPEHLMAQAETRKYGNREVKKIPVAGMNRKEIIRRRREDPFLQVGDDRRLNLGFSAVRCIAG